MIEVIAIFPYPKAEVLQCNAKAFDVEYSVVRNISTLNPN